MRRLTGWLALIAIVGGGLGLLLYEDLKLRHERSEMPSAITAGTPEGAGDELAEAAPSDDSSLPPASVSGEATTADAAPVEDSAPDVMASAESSPAAGRPAVSDAPVAASGETLPTPAEESAATAPLQTKPETAQDVPAPEAAEPVAGPPGEPEAMADAAPAEPPASVAPETPAVVAGAAAPESESSQDVAARPPEPAAELPETTAPATAAVPIPEDEPAQKPPVAAVAGPPAASGSEPAAAAPAPEAVTGTEVAIAPEIEAQPPAGGTPPASESSGRDSMMQASPGTESAPVVPEIDVAAVDREGGVEAAKPAAPPAVAPGAVADALPVTPSFDIVRVEPTGDAVIAGVAAPGATVELTDGASTVATAVASDTGDWAIALDQPLPAGQHDLGIRATSRETGAVTESEQRVAVLVPETPAEEPLVVLNAPDAPSTILQVPAAPEPASGNVAVLDTPAFADAATPEPVGEGAAAAPAETAAATPPAAAVTEPAAGEVSPDIAGAGSAGPALSEADAGMTPAAIEPDASDVVEPEAAAVPSEVTPGEPPSVPAVTEPAPPSPAVAGEAPETEPQVAAAEPEPVPQPEPQPEPEPEPAVTPVVAVTAVEAETSGALFVAGTAVTPEDVRVYLDDVLLGEVTPSPSGTWLLEVQRELPAGTYHVRADQVEPGAGTVLARAEVPFEREVEVAVLRPVAEAGGAAGAEATGTMAGPTTLIIKRRDNLWRISRQLYGKGIRWSTIYQANKDQIRNPRWIYPGQVFILPEGNVEWEEEDAAN